MTPEYLKDREVEERKQIMLDVSEGMKSVYWKHLSNKVKSWILVEQKLIDSFDQVTPENQNAFNEAKIRIRLLNNFLKINEMILKDQHTWLDRMVRPINKAFHYVKTFVGNKN